MDNHPVDHLDKETDPARLWGMATWLALFTIAYNLIEGLVSIWFGAEDEALTLFGFGIDSFIEVLSGVGILIMILRIRHNPNEPRNGIEQVALRITGAAFYLLAAGLGITAVVNLISGHKPETSLPGVIISLISIAIMWALVATKRRVGRKLQSAPILADANCTLVCIYMSIVLLAASLIYWLTGFGFIDSLGAIGLIYFSIHEGREAFEKAKNHSDTCQCNNTTELKTDR
jgi:divalent metal cation (Fe/Co/Zn/Cd) transporter